MSKGNVVSIQEPTGPRDALTDVLRSGARRLLAEAIEAEVEEYLTQYQEVDEQGRRRVVRNGYLPEREIQTGLGGVAVKVPRTRDRSSAGPDEALQFRSKLVPPYLRRAKSVEGLLPWLYLRGISTGECVILRARPISRSVVLRHISRHSRAQSLGTRRSNTSSR